MMLLKLKKYGSLIADIRVPGMDGSVFPEIDQQAWLCPGLAILRAIVFRHMGAV